MILSGFTTLALTLVVPVLSSGTAVLTGATPVPSPTDLDPVDVTPGVGGFIATFGVVIVTVLLMIDMNRRIRRLRNRQRQEQQLLQQQRADGEPPADREQDGGGGA